MDLKTRAFYVAQMNKTQTEFDKLKTIVVDLPMTDESIPEIRQEILPDGIKVPSPSGFPIICDGCHMPATVPFKPNTDRQVFCLTCFKANNKRGY